MNHLQNGAEIDVSGYNAVEAKNYLIAKGYEIQIKQTKYEITITSDSVTSTDDSFTMDNISATNDASKGLRQLSQKDMRETIQIRCAIEGFWII